MKILKNLFKCFFSKKTRTYTIFLDDFYFEELETKYSFLQNNLMEAFNKNNGKFRAKSKKA